MFKQILKILYASVRTFGSGTTVQYTLIRIFWIFIKILRFMLVLLGVPKSGTTLMRIFLDLLKNI